MAAVLSDRHGIFSWGWNGKGAGLGRHAEEHVLLRANPRRVRGATLTLAGRRTRSGNWVYAYPCSGARHNCLALIRKRGVLLLEWLDKEGFWHTNRL